jgi:hypothetical protein
MSWAELDAYLTGYANRVELTWQMNAQLAAWLLQPHSKRIVKASDLYKSRAERTKADTPKRMPTPDELTQIVHERIKWLQ